MDNFYQIIFPPRMTSDHPVPLPTVNAMLPAVSAVSYFIASTHDDIERHKADKMSAFTAINNNILISSYLQNQKKEVTDDKMNLKHCKTVQCNMYLTQARKFFNN